MHIHQLSSTFVFASTVLFSTLLPAQVDALSAALLRDGPTSSSISDTAARDAEVLPEAAQDDRKFRSRVTQLPLYDWWHHPGLSVSVGINGVGVDVAEAIRERVNIRVGAEFARYSGQFIEQNALVNLNVRLGGGHAGLDLFPFRRSSFHVSPQLRFGIMTRGFGDVTIPPGEVISFNNVDYTSTAVDPLRGTASFDTRKIAPGISVGFGNLVPRTRDQHWSFPVDLGFYYIGQPNVSISFRGTACSVNSNRSQDCDDVTQDPDFQKDLQKFIERQRHNASYASLFPVLSFGVGYRF